MFFRNGTNDFARKIQMVMVKPTVKNLVIQSVFGKLAKNLQDYKIYHTQVRCLLALCNFKFLFDLQHFNNIDINGIQEMSPLTFP